jgi:hypothetical protein
VPPRIIKIYDGPFPTVEDMMFGDPATRAPIPKEIWSEQMEEGEVALFCVNFKNQMPVREEDGRPARQSDEVCRVSSDIPEMLMHAKETVRLHPSIVCVLRRKDGSEISRISNNRFLWRFALASYFGIGLWLIGLTALGTSIILVLRALAIRARFDISALSLKQWAVLLLGGAVLGVVAVIGWTWFSVQRRTKRLVSTLNESLTPQEKLRYKEINSLSGSINVEDRRRGKQLSEEYYRRLVQIRRTKKQSGS